MDKNTDDYKYLVKKLREYFSFHEDFPKVGVNYWDMFPLLGNHDAFHTLILLLKYYADAMNGKVDVVASIESKGFLLGPIIAEQLGATCIPIRKKGKLPGNVKSTTYSLEYGTDTIEIQDGCVSTGQRVLIVDDLLATGGTLAAACDLLASNGAEVVDCLVIVDKPEMNGKDKVNAPITVLCGSV